MEIKFKNGKTYELEDAGRDGIIVFKDAIYKASFDKDWVTNVWKKCSLKKRLESWWEKNAPNALKEKYDVSLLSIEEVFNQEEIDSLFNQCRRKNPKSNQLPLFAGGRKARIKRLLGGETSCWWWLRSPLPWSDNWVLMVTTNGSLSGTAYRACGCVLACYPKGYLSSVK